MKKTVLVVMSVVVATISVMACHHHDSSQKEPLQVAEKTDAQVVQKICPVMGGKINQELFVEQDGKKVYVCCGNCVEKVEKDFEKYLGIVEDAAKEYETKEGKVGGHMQDYCCAGR